MTHSYVCHAGHTYEWVMSHVKFFWKIWKTWKIFFKIKAVCFRVYIYTWKIFHVQLYCYTLHTTFHAHFAWRQILCVCVCVWVCVCLIQGNMCTYVCVTREVTRDLPKSPISIKRALYQSKEPYSKSKETCRSWRDLEWSVTWLLRIYMCDMTHAHVWHDPFIHVLWRVKTCDVKYSYLWHDSFMQVTWLIHTCDMTHSYVCDMTRPYV